MNYIWPAPNVSGFIAQLVRASHRYREVTNPVQWSPEFFSVFFTQLHIIAFTTARISLHLIPFPQFIYDSFHIHHSRFNIYHCFLEWEKAETVPVIIMTPGRVEVGRTDFTYVEDEIDTTIMSTIFNQSRKSSFCELMDRWYYESLASGGNATTHLASFGEPVYSLQALSRNCTPLSCCASCQIALYLLKRLFFVPSHRLSPILRLLLWDHSLLLSVTIGIMSSHRC